MAFKDELKAIRRELGIPQTKLAEFTTVPLRTLQKWEAGSNQPPPYVQHMLLEILKNLKV